MRKPKKITVKFFLNPKVEPATGEGGKRYYPLYIQVTYDRKNTQLRSFYGEYYERLEEVPADLKAFEQRIIEQIITHEAGQGEPYDLKGLKQRFEVYSTSIAQAVEDYVKPRLWKAIQQTGDELISVLEFRQPKATTRLLYKAALRLFDHFGEGLNEALKADLNAYTAYQRLVPRHQFGFDFPAVADWITGSYQTKLDRELKKAVKETAVRQEVKRLIEEAITEHLKHLNQR